MEIKINNGKISFSIYDLFENLGEEELKEIAQAYSWYLPAYQELIRSLRNEYVSENFNSNIFDIRKKFFTLDIPDEWERDHDIISSMKNTMVAIFEQNAKIQVHNWKLTAAYDKVLSFISSRFGRELAADIHKMYLNEVYGRNDKTDYQAASEMVKNFDFEKLVTDWCEAMNEIMQEAGIKNGEV